MKSNKIITIFGFVLSLSLCSSQTLCKATEFQSNTYISEVEEVNDTSNTGNSSFQTPLMYCNESERVNLIDQKLEERSMVISQINHSSELSSTEKEELEAKLNLLNSELAELGVINDVPDEIKESRTNYPASNTNLAAMKSKAKAAAKTAVYPTTYFDFYKNAINVSSYESSYTYNGVSYRTCTVYLTDKPSSYEHLSKVYIVNKVLQGKLKDITMVEQFTQSTIIMLLEKGASYIPQPYIKYPALAILSKIPDYEPQYMVTSNDKTLILNEVGVDEYIRYIYVYDEQNNDWILSGAANQGICNQAFKIWYRPANKLKYENVKKELYFYGDYSTIRQDSVAWFALNKQIGCNSFAPLDGVIKRVNLSYNGLSSKTDLVSINLCADQYPGYINLNN